MSQFGVKVSPHPSYWAQDPSCVLNEPVLVVVSGDDYFRPKETAARVDFEPRLSLCAGLQEASH